MLRIYFHIVKAAWKNFGLKPIFWGWLLLLPLFALFTHFTLWLDRFFFPQYLQVKVKDPIFIIGNPRSGTSFLHRSLTQTGEFAAFETWQLFLPSLTARALFKPIINYLIRSDRATIMPESNGHGLYLNAIEHDEFLFLHKLDTQFAILLTPLAFDDREYPELRQPDLQPDSRRRSSARFFKECLQRHLYYTSKERVIAQGHFSTNRIKTLIETFPDARFIYLVRSPYETIPSHLSLEYKTFQHLWNKKNIPTDKLQRYLQRRYQYDIELYRYFYELQKNQEIPREKIVILRYGELCSSLESAFEQIVAFTEIKPSKKLQQAIKLQAQKQKNYQRKHKINALEEFSLTSEQIAEDFDFVFDKYGFDHSHKSRETSSPKS